MKLLFVTVVAVFLLYSVTAERSGPKNTRLSTRRRFAEENLQARSSSSSRRGISTSQENPSKNGKRKPNGSKVMGVQSAHGRNLRRRIPGPMSRENPFIPTSRYVKCKKSGVRFPRTSVTGESHQARRSLDVNAKSDHPSNPTIIHDAVFLEPVHHREPKNSFFGYTFDPDTDSEGNPSLGPLIGPLNFPGMGKNVHIRLMVPPDEETASHVTVHLVSDGPVETIGKHFLNIQNQKPLFFGTNFKTLATIRPNKLITSSPLNSVNNRFVEKSVNHFDPAPSRVESSGFLKAQNQREIPEGVTNREQYLQTIQHNHQLPLAPRQAADNLIDLPIYPPLSAEGYSEDEIKNRQNKNEVVLNSGGKIDAPDVRDVEGSGSSKHSLVSLDGNRNVNPPIVWRSVGDLATSNPRESPEPVFMEEVKAPDLGTYNISMTNEVQNRGEARNSTILKLGVDESPSLRLGSGARTPTSHLEDQYLPFDYSSGRNYVISKNLWASKYNAEDEPRATTPNDLSIDSGSLNGTEKTN